MVSDDGELDELRRREVAKRLDGLLRAVGAGRDEAHAWEVFRHAHSLAGLADDEEVVLAARRLSRLFSDGRGNVHVPDQLERAEAMALAQELAQRRAQL